MDKEDFRRRLIKWYRLSKRDLPWRMTSDPYAIWLSEIILQQTRVTQGLEYYNRMLKVFPDIFSLAHATEDEVMRIWQGLGYYSRARYMLETARNIVAEYNGNFPSHSNEIILLKGIGEYTAAAIASIVYGEVIPVIDGNVLRVISRYLGIEQPINDPKVKRSIKAELESLIEPNYPGEFNQAMMELGALCCTPRNPSCISCPQSNGCYAYQHGRQSLIPFKKSRVNVRTRYFHYLVVNHQDFVYLNKRAQKDIWKSLYDFPLIESKRDISPARLLDSPDFRKLFQSCSFRRIEFSEPYMHQLTHQLIKARFYRLLPFISCQVFEKQFLKVSITKLPEYAFPRLIEKYLADSRLQEAFNNNY